MTGSMGFGNVTGIIDVLQNEISETILVACGNNKKVYDITGLEKFSIQEDEKIFYKFIILRDIKAEILKELYMEGYSEEQLFPGYKGVTDYIKNKSKLDEIQNLIK